MDPKKFEIPIPPTFTPIDTRPIYQLFESPLRPEPTPIRPNVRAALDYLDQILCKETDDAQDLWDILTALRGPDDDVSTMKHAYYDPGGELKRRVTIPVRRAAFPRTTTAVTAADRQINAAPKYIARPTVGVRSRASFGGTFGDYPFKGEFRADHFSKHGIHAAQALGLI